MEVNDIQHWNCKKVRIMKKWLEQIPRDRQRDWWYLGCLCLVQSCVFTHMNDGSIIWDGAYSKCPFWGLAVEQYKRMNNRACLKAQGTHPTFLLSVTEEEESSRIPSWTLLMSSDTQTEPRLWLLLCCLQLICGRQQCSSHFSSTFRGTERLH